MGQLTSAGYVPERLDAILVTLDQGFRAIYGDDINTDPDTPDGQMIGLIAQIKADLEELGEAIYRALDPDHAGGVWLEQRVAYAGLLRRRSAYSYLRRVALAGTPGEPVLTASVVQDESKQRWQLVADAVFAPDGSVRADFRSVEKGAFELSDGVELEIITKTRGWSGAVTTEPAEVGAEEERDPVLLNRFYKSRSRGAQNSVDGIEANIGQLPDVREVICLENDGDSTDEDGVPRKSINVIVDGGNDADIAQVIFDYKTAGTGMRGDVQVNVIDKRGRTRPTRFDRPAEVDCGVYIEVERNADYTAIDTDAIKAAIVATAFLTGQDVQHSRMYSPINTVPGFWVSLLKIGRVGSALAESNIAIGVREKARFSAVDIEVIVL
ncbi:MAG: baseplate J/gp47 family protein [Burkholderiaceae bacterium]|nr:baseplate J/gp47 family protein [Burkholderiaceae bacterium]